MQIENYKIIEEINHTGQSTVYKATYKNNTCAVKVMDLPLQQKSLRFLKKVPKESLENMIKAGIICKNPNLPSKEHQDRFYFGMKYKNKENLYEAIKSPDGGSYLKDREIIKIAYQVIKQIKVIHDQNIVHRNIRLKNIVDHKNPSITNFEMAEYLGNRNFIYMGQEFSCVIGCAPMELITDLMVLKTSDIYNFGILLYQLNFREFPITNYEFSENLFCKRQIDLLAGTEMKQIKEIPNQKLRNIATKCAQNNRNKRPTAEELIKEFETFI